MDKQTIITLLRKDIAELMQLTEGFDQIEQCPQVLIHLALQKTRSVEQILNELLVLPQQRTAEVNYAVQPEIKQEVVTENYLSETKVEEPVVSIPKQEEPIIELTQPEALCEEIDAVEEEVVVELTENTLEDNSVEVNVESQEPTVEEIPVEAVQEEVVEEDSMEEVENTSIDDETTPCETTLEEEEEEEIEEEIEEPIVEKEVTITIPKTEFVTRNDSIVNSKIDDISKAISLGDRFLFQRELFANNGELMQKTIVHLNSLSSIEEAYTYIQKKFTWDKESATTERFLQLISRRYL